MATTGWTHDGALDILQALLIQIDYDKYRAAIDALAAMPRHDPQADFPYLSHLDPQEVQKLAGLIGAAQGFGGIEVVPQRYNNDTTIRYQRITGHDPVGVRYKVEYIVHRAPLVALLHLALATASIPPAATPSPFAPGAGAAPAVPS
jgi:hypothetical protein